MNIHSHRNLRPGGFTLLELLVVISIISLLVTIITPSFASARRYAKQVLCASQLKGIGAGWHMYLDDYPNALPYAANLPIDSDDISIVDVMGKYVLKDNWSCPGDDQDYFKKYSTSYEYLPGLALIPNPAFEPVILDMYEKKPDQYAVLADADAFHPLPGEPHRRMSMYFDAHVDMLKEPQE